MDWLNLTQTDDNTKETQKTKYSETRPIMVIVN